MYSRMLTLAIGYLFGNLVTAELVARAVAKKAPSEIGSGNPGMANIARNLGVRWGVLVLLGDILKLVLAAAAAWYLFLSGNVPQTADPSLTWPVLVLWTGAGATLGHNFPFWRGFKGGKGVAVGVASIILAHPATGIPASLVGLFAVLMTGWLPLGAVVIMVLFTVLAFIFIGPEAGGLGVAYTLMMVFRFRKGLKEILDGTCYRARPFSFITDRFAKKDK